MFCFASGISVKQLFLKKSQFFAEILTMTRVLRHFYLAIDQLILCFDVDLVLYCAFIQKGHYVKSQKSH